MELSNDVVRVVHRRVALLALHSDAYRALADHRHVVGAVADRQTAQPFFFHQQNHAGLLLGGHPRADDRRGVAHRVDERRLLRSDELIDGNAVENEREGGDRVELRRRFATIQREDLKDSLETFLVLCVVFLDPKIFAVVRMIQHGLQLQRDVLFGPCQVEKLHRVGQQSAVPRDNHGRLFLIAYLAALSLLYLSPSPL